MYRTLGFSFTSLVLGILIGGALIALLPHPNKIHLTVMPYQGVSISPEVGDTIEWSAYGQKTPPTITFSSFTGSPCRDKNPGSSCVYDDAGNGIYIYSCSGSATCDPSMGPGSGTRGGSGAILIPIFQTIARLLQGVAITIDRTLGLIARDQTTVVSPPNTATTANSSPQVTSAPLPLGVADAGNPDAQVGCINNKTSVNNPSITKSVGKSISWVGSSPFAITIDQSICQGNMSTPWPVQSCTVLKEAPPTAYTINDASCTAQPTLNTPTITAIAATPATR